jgi:hypothetical protein
LLDHKLELILNRSLETEELQTTVEPEMFVARKWRRQVCPLVNVYLLDQARVFLIGLVNRLKEKSSVRAQVGPIIGFNNNEQIGFVMFSADKPVTGGVLVFPVGSPRSLGGWQVLA